MKKWTATLFTLVFLLVLWANGKPILQPIAHAPGNIAEGTYMIVGEASKRCLEVPNNACGNEIGLQTFDCDRTDASNNQKFNVIADGSGNYTITAVHSDLCLEIYNDQNSDRIMVRQNACSGAASQKWAMSQYGVNLEIRAVQNNQCMDIMARSKANYGLVNMHACADGTNQRWRLYPKTLNNETGVICRASPSHPEHNCSGVNYQQKPTNLGKTLTKARCEEACRVNKMISCQWDVTK